MGFVWPVKGVNRPHAEIEAMRKAGTRPRSGLFAAYKMTLVVDASLKPVRARSCGPTMVKLADSEPFSSCPATIRRTPPSDEIKAALHPRIRKGRLSAAKLSPT